MQNGQPRGPKFWLNFAAASLWVSIAAWVFWVDLETSGDPLFQSSSSLSIAFLYLILWALAAVVSAVIPKRVVIAITLSFISRLAFGYPFSLFVEPMTACRLSSALMLISALWYCAMVLREVFDRPWMALRHSVTMVMLLGVMVISLVPWWIVGTERAARELLGNYTQFSVKGIHLREKQMQRDDQVVHLVGMMHVGKGEFYQDLITRMNLPIPAGGRRLVLTEGVADRDSLLPRDFASGNTYGRLAKTFGVESQPALGPPVDTTDPTAKDGPVVWENADLDIADLSEKHRNLLIVLLRAMADGPLGVATNPELAKLDGKVLEDLFKNGLIISRNKALMADFDRMAGDFSEIYIPWGAAHLPDIERRLRARGFEVIEESTRPIIQFWN